MNIAVYKYNNTNEKLESKGTNIGEKIEDIQIDNFEILKSSGMKLPLIVLYRNTKDYPGKCVARVFDGKNPSNIVMLAEDIKAIIRKIPIQMFPIGRMNNDDKCIVGTWI